jgi:hypothetical protein
MKLFDIDWNGFLAKLELFHKLPIDARRFFVEQVKPATPVSKGILAQFREPLVASGLMVMSPTGSHANVDPECRDFSRVIRAMARSRVYASPSRDTFQFYLNDNLTTPEVTAFSGPGAWGRLDHHELQRIYGSVCSKAWPQGFLDAQGTSWELAYGSAGQPHYLSSMAILRAAQRLVQAIAESGPVMFSRIPEILPDTAPETIGGAIRATLRYLLLFPFLRHDDLEPMVGLWPGLAEKLLNKAPAQPEPVVVGEPFHAPFLMEDMVAILSACTVEPIRLRGNDMRIFEAARQGLEESLGTLPEWIEASFHCGPEERIEFALGFLRGFVYLKQAGRPGADFRLEPTREGAVWLAMRPKERLRALIDGLRGSRKNDEALFEDEVMSLAPDLSALTTRADSVKLLPFILEGFASVPGDKYLRLADFLAWQSKTNNGLATLVKKDRYFSIRINWQYVSGLSEEETERIWGQTLFNFLRGRLLPLGAVTVAVEAGQNAICLALTDAGRYLLGTAQDFDMAGDPAAHVLIQPNFDVVFLTPSARVEANLARIGERKGRHVGPLFRITKNSVFAAAAAGVTRDGVLETLREHCAAGIPPNVEAEINGWFARYRQVNVQPATLIHCPDAETAARVLATLGKKAARLTDTVIELRESKIQSAMAKKLREAGIFIRT